MNKIDLSLFNGQREIHIKNSVLSQLRRRIFSKSAAFICWQQVSPPVLGAGGGRFSCRGIAFPVMICAVNTVAICRVVAKIVHTPTEGAPVSHNQCGLSVPTLRTYSCTARGTS